MAAFPWAEEGQMMDSHHYTIKQRQQHLINSQERLSAYNILLLILEKRSRLKKILFWYFLWCQKNITILPMEGHWKFQEGWGSSRPKFWNGKIVSWRENYIASGVSGCLWWGRGWGRDWVSKPSKGGVQILRTNTSDTKKNIKKLDDVTS